jgi:hypothetical protein
LPFGQLAVLELREDDPKQPPLPRPGDEKLGPLFLRSVEAMPDGRGWKLTVQAFTPGVAVVPPLDLGDGRRTPELRVKVDRSIPFGAPWMGVGGGREDELPEIPFPYGWASLHLLPFALLGYYLFRRWRRNSGKRRQKKAKAAFAKAWPPPSKQREALDAAHAAGREWLATVVGAEARSWGPKEFRAQSLDPWATWVESLDAARFGRTTPAFPPLLELKQSLSPFRPIGGQP